MYLEFLAGKIDAWTGIGELQGQIELDSSTVAASECDLFKFHFL